MDSFLEYFEDYVNDYLGDRETFEKQHKQHNKLLNPSGGGYVRFNEGDPYFSPIIASHHMNNFKKYCKFLNKIPHEAHEKEAKYLFKIFSQYSSSWCEYDTTYDNAYDNGTKNMSDKLKRDIKSAKKFRDSLSSKKIDTSMDVESYNTSIELDTLSSYDTMSILRLSLSMYIHDMETKQFHVRPKSDFMNFFPKPSIDPLINYLKNIAKRHEIKNITSDLNEFKKNIHSFYEIDD